MVVEIKELSVSYGKNPALRDVSFRLNKGDILFVLGNNGSGKTTLLYSIFGIIPHSIKANLSGEIKVFGKSPMPPEKMAGKAAFLFQNPDDQLFCSTVWEELIFGAKNTGRFDKERSLQLLKEAGLEKYKNHNPFELSYGLRQKLCFYSLIAMDAELYLLDEPTSALDVKSREEVYRKVVNLSKKGKTFIIVEHNLEKIKEMDGRFILLENGRIAMEGKSSEIDEAKKVLG